MKLDEFVTKLNQWGDEGIPFFFLVDFELQRPVAIRLNELDADVWWYDFNGKSNHHTSSVSEKAVDLRKAPVLKKTFAEKFDKVLRHLSYGDSFLANLTIKTKIETEFSLKDIYTHCKARYKLLYNDQFLVFSPEQFVRINGRKIYSYPMKGTIDASIPDAESLILGDRKEMAEHVTIVDLIRNDLSIIADNVTVSRFRYVEELKTNNKRLLQVSSEIVGDLPKDFRSRIGDILVSLLPAGSISGAPKPKTIQILKEAEGEDRGFYTGVAGIFDGENLDSGVLIRFIEKTENGLFYRSGAGITTQSVMEKEYQEVIDKVYVPVD